MSRRKRLKHTTIYLVVVCLVRLLGLLPHRVALAVGRWVGLLAWRLGRRERRRALSNLALAEQGASDPHRQRLVRQMFVLLGRSAMECVVMGRLRGKLGTASSPVRHASGAREVLEQALARGRGVLYVTAHLGNWELMAAEVARMAPVTVLYKPSYDPRFTEMIIKFRELNGVRGISATAAGHLRQVLASLARGEVIGVLLDQPVPSGCQVPFFDRPAWTSNLVSRLHHKTGAPIVFGYMESHCPDPGRHILHMSPISETNQGDTCLTQRLTREVERAVRRNPAQWLWSLDRWRSTESGHLSTHRADAANSIPAASN